MPVHHTICYESGMIVVEYSGNITTEQVLRFLDTYEPNLQRHPSFKELIDLSEVSSVSISSSELVCLHALICGVYRRNPPSRELALVSQGRIGRGLAEDFLHFAHQHSALVGHLCDDRHEALFVLEAAAKPKNCGYWH